jgi:isoamyl acetate esterase
MMSPSFGAPAPRLLLALAAAVACGIALADGPPVAELDAFWAELARSVKTGDFKACVASYHPDAVLVIESKDRTEPIEAALARWEREFADTRDGSMTADLVSKVTRRLGDDTTAHETGMFRYTAQKRGGEPKVNYVPFESLLVKRDGRWMMVMEYQKDHATKAEWDALAASAATKDDAAIRPPAKGERIVFLGDSITQAGDKGRGYVVLVREAITKEMPDAGVEVLGAGISGHKVPDLEKRLDRDVIQKNPTTVVIYIGINDVWHSKRGQGTPKDVYEKGLRSLVERVRAAGGRVILCTPSVIGEKAVGDNPFDAMLDEYAGITRRVASEMKTGLIDLRKAFVDHLAKANTAGGEKGVLTNDGVHLHDAGNRFVADRMLEGLGLTPPAP